MGFFVPLEIFHSYGVDIIDLCSALMAIEHRGHFSVPQLLLHEASVYNGYLRGPVTPIAERLAVELSLLVFTTRICRGWYSNTQTSACKAKALTQCTTPVVRSLFKTNIRFLEAGTKIRCQIVKPYGTLLLRNLHDF